MNLVELNQEKDRKKYWQKIVNLMEENKKNIKIISNILIEVRNKIHNYTNQRSLWRSIKTVFCRSSRVTLIYNLLKNRNLTDKEEVIKVCGNISTLPCRMKSRIPKSFIDVCSKVQREYDKNCEERLFDNYSLIDDKSFAAGVQGSIYNCKLKNSNKEYVMKKIDLKNEGHDPVASEVLACESLKNIYCKYISKPISYKINGKKSGDIIYKKEQGLNCYDFVRKLKEYSCERCSKYFFDIINELLEVVNTLHNVAHIAHGDMNHENYLLSLYRDDIIIKVIDFGYSYKLKSKYNKTDVLEMCHPFTSIVHFFNGIQYFGNALSKKSIESLKQSLYNTQSQLMDFVLKSISEEGWPVRFAWRKKYVNEILKIKPEECNKFINNIRQWKSSQI